MTTIVRPAEQAATATTVSEHCGLSAVIPMPPLDDMLHPTMFVLGKVPAFEPLARLYAVARKPGAPASFIPEALQP